MGLGPEVRGYFIFFSSSNCRTSLVLWPFIKSDV
jgi:hypothetical protein